MTHQGRWVTEKEEMSIRYKAIVIDHDDTAFDSTPSVHYPAYVRYCEEKMPKDFKMLTLEGWYEMLWHSDISVYQKEVMKLTPEEQKIEFFMWKEFVGRFTPNMFPGFLEFLKEFRRRGGIIAVCSHSTQDDIERNYARYNFQPEVIYGYSREHPEMCKPYTYPIENLKEKYHLEAKDIAMIDDLSPGFQMAKKCGVDCIGVIYGKGHDTIKGEIAKTCKKTFDTVEGLKEYILMNTEE
ncbi:hypothetical protein EIN_254290 [Entamoeba invadens IP1]|uniref:Phosphoglycolate phosphatase n=1 Tax=Entamoeba invadens IP1 TaxID=370355 RepID=A0A0A1UEU9_ENTIV|nr:hypothetical protein EIN_254290 [Entamoeba invadens IP1]ELP95095.1 hypothetical protein EIN_254290 [Entamoeba invadens IP1]|eukprot:XP_004261866.1 hypothetical protein EIN_254290 [Entamoeba invadens IP1]